MFWFNKEYVYIGYSMEEFYQIRHMLGKKGIKYSYKVINHAARRRGRSGSFGINPDYERQYVVSVKKDDYEEARYIVLFYTKSHTDRTVRNAFLTVSLSYCSPSHTKGSTCVPPETTR